MMKRKSILFSAFSKLSAGNCSDYEIIENFKSSPCLFPFQLEYIDSYLIWQHPEPLYRKEKTMSIQIANANKVGKNIRRICLEKQMSYYMLAKNAGMPLTTLMHIVDGSSKNPGIYTIERLCDVLHISLIDVMKEI